MASSGSAIVMEDGEFNKQFGRILEFIYEVEEKSRKKSDTQQIKYRNDQLSLNGNSFEIIVNYLLTSKRKPQKR